MQPLPTRKRRILVVDDSAVARRMLTSFLSDVSDFDVVGSASNGRVALRRIEQLHPELVLLDLEMPEMDGLELLAKLQADGVSAPVIVVSSISRRGALSTIEALSLGARDYVTKPSSLEGSGSEEFRRVLVDKIRALLARSPANSQEFAPAPPVAPTQAQPAPVVSARATHPTELLMIGTSTGGPEALTKILAALPGDFPVPIAIVQHMPPLFTKYLARSLNDACPLRVEEAHAGAVLEPGRVLLAPGGHHMRVTRRRGRFQVLTTEDQPVNSCRPSVDVMFESAAELGAEGMLAVVLTGMGRDGLQGARRLVDRGGTVFAQDQASSVVWGMPGHVVQAGLAARVLDVSAVAEAVVAHVANAAARALERRKP